MREVAEEPPLEIRTKILVPEVKVVWARERFRSKSMARWAATDPAARAVVPSPEMNMVGGGWREDRDLDQVLVFVDVTDVSLLDGGGSHIEDGTKIFLACFFILARRSSKLCFRSVIPVVGIRPLI